MITSQTCILIVIAVYLIGMLLIGIACSKKNENVDDFYLGGRQLSPLVTAMSAEASDMSSWLLMGLPGVAYLTGLAEASWTAIGLALGTYINWLIVAKRLRIYSSDINAITIPEFFSKRFGDNRNFLSCIAAIVIVVFFVPYTASGFAACGKLFNTILGVDYMTAMVVSALVIILYCVMGGFLAASTTDFIQSIVMTIALVVILGFGEGIVHGFDHVIANARELPGYLSLTNIHVPATGECDKEYNRKIHEAADRIIKNMEKSPIVLLSGPSGSGKTTTALKIEEELERRGIRTHAIAMDNYFRTYVPGTLPLTESGLPDFESPLYMDMELLNEHFDMLSRGERIYVPKFEFARQIRIVKPAKSLKLGKDEIAIFEGIHALNDEITSQNPDAFKLYISAYSNVVDEKYRLCFTGVWMRLCRRMVRDNLFRGATPNHTLSLWPNVRRSERRYIAPFVNKADYFFDSSFPYEVSIMKNLAPVLLREIPETAADYEELEGILPAFEKFVSIDPAVLPSSSLLREFIGGGIYEY